jgi:hypothetical protein
MNHTLWVRVSYLSGSLSLSQSRNTEQNDLIWILLFLAAKIGFWDVYPSSSVGYFWTVSWLKGPRITRTRHHDFRITVPQRWWLVYQCLLVFMYREVHYFAALLPPVLGVGWWQMDSFFLLTLYMLLQKSMYRSCQCLINVFSKATLLILHHCKHVSEWLS